MPLMRKQAKDTLTAVELDRGDVLEFTLMSGQVVAIVLLSTDAEVVRTTSPPLHAKLRSARVAGASLPPLQAKSGCARTDYRFSCDLKADGQQVQLEREVSTQKSFYEPWSFAGVHVWLDAVDDIFEFMLETHGECRPKKHVRLAIQDASLPISPEPIHPWCPLPDEGLRIEQCYRGEDCWLGAYNGVSAHGGLDINHPRGTPLWAPIDIHDHFYFNSLEMGHNNNRWRGIHRWPNGSEWILQAHHMTELTVPEHQPITKGQQLAWGAGVLSGSVDHSHFVFKVHDEGETVLLDPWILFWQMYRDREARNC